MATIRLEQHGLTQATYDALISDGMTVPGFTIEAEVLKGSLTAKPQPGQTVEVSFRTGGHNYVMKHAKYPRGSGVQDFLTVSLEGEKPASEDSSED